MLKNKPLPVLAFLQATGLVVYLILISLFFNYVTPNFDGEGASFFAPIVMLLLFISSAVISALLVLGQAAILFWKKKYDDAFTLVGWTVGWGLLYAALFLILMPVK